MANETSEETFSNSVLTVDQYVFILASCAILSCILSLLGIVSNILNVSTFITMGLKDGVTVSFLFLTLFDFGFLMVAFCYGIFIGLQAVEIKCSVRFELQPLGLFLFFGNIMVLINVTNTLTTTFIAVARCMCVVRPLSFKNTFTRSRTILFNLGFVLFAAATYTPILVNMGMAKTNMTRPALWVSKNRKVIQVTVWVVMNIIIFFTEVIIIFCIFVMTSSLRTASQFRQASTVKCHLQNEKEASKPEKTQSSTATSTNKLAGKEQRVVQQVILISLVYIICNTPKILICIVTATEPQFTLNGRYSKLCLSTHSLQKLFEIVNASVNTFIYYSYNTKFRTKMRELVSNYPDEVGTR